MSNIFNFIQTAEASTSAGTLTTIFGDSGQGKTTVAYVCFPAPLFIPIEQGLRSVPGAHSTTVPTESNHVNFLLEQIETAIDTDRASFPYRTIILDSISELDTMIARELCKADNVESLNAYMKGFGRGASVVANRQREVKEICNRLVRKGLHVVAICHADSKIIEQPDSEPYSRWVLQLVKGAQKEWTSGVDAVIHVKSSVILSQRKGSDHVTANTIKNKRTLNMVAEPATVSKNRFFVNEPLTFEYNPATNSFNNPLASIYNF